MECAISVRSVIASWLLTEQNERRKRVSPTLSNMGQGQEDNVDDGDLHEISLPIIYIPLYHRP